MTYSTYFKQHQKSNHKIRVGCVVYMLKHKNLNSVERWLRNFKSNCHKMLILVPWKLTAPTVQHRESTSTTRELKGRGRHLFTQIEPYWTLPYSAVPVPLLGVARPAGWVTFCSIYASTVPRAKNMAVKGLILFLKAINFSYLPIIYLCCTVYNMYMYCT